MFRLSLLSILVATGCAINWGPEADAYWRTGATSAEVERDYDHCKREAAKRAGPGGESVHTYVKSCMIEHGYELIVRFHCSEEDLKDGFVLSVGRPPLPPAGDVLCLKPVEPRGFVIREGLNYARGKDYFTATGTW